MLNAFAALRFYEGVAGVAWWGRCQLARVKYTSILGRDK